MSQPFDEFPNDPSVPPELRNNIFISTIDKFYNWGRKRSMWPMMFGAWSRARSGSFTSRLGLLSTRRGGVSRDQVLSPIQWESAENPD